MCCNSTSCELRNSPKLPTAAKTSGTPQLKSNKLLLVTVAKEHYLTDEYTGTPLCFYISSTWARYSAFRGSSGLPKISLPFFTLFIFTPFTRNFRGFKVVRKSACVNMTCLIESSPFQLLLKSVTNVKRMQHYGRPRFAPLYNFHLLLLLLPL